MGNLLLNTTILTLSIIVLGCLGILLLKLYIKMLNKIYQTIIRYVNKSIGTIGVFIIHITISLFLTILSVLCIYIIYTNGNDNVYLSIYMSIGLLYMTCIWASGMNVTCIWDMIERW